jgi:hypothetical protein
MIAPLRTALAGLLRGPLVAATLRELLAATVARDAAHTAHTNAGPSMRRAAMDALTLARGRYTRAVEAAARVVGR